MLRQNEESFALIVLGTDTPIEGETLLADYERGETLNAIYRALKGTDFIDKHIVSGTDTLANTIQTQINETTLMALFAISEGKKAIKFAAHSRGGIETLLAVGLLNEIKEAIRTSQCEINKASDHERNKIKEIEIHKIKIAIREKLKITAPKKNSEPILRFTSEQKKTTKNQKITVHNHAITINVEKLIENFTDQINCQLFIIDPVPGQGNMMVNSWRKKQFFRLPAIVAKAEIIYLENERSNFFEPVSVDLVEKSETILTHTYLPGHHGTASGKLTEQSPIGNKSLIEDEFKDYYENGIINKINKGKHTRHVQKITIAKLVELFGHKAFSEKNIDEMIKENKSIFPRIEKTIKQLVTKHKENAHGYFKKIYDKVAARKSHYKKFDGTCYAGTTLLSKTPTTRLALTEAGSRPLQDKSQPLPTGHINEEHIKMHTTKIIKSDLMHIEDETLLIESIDNFIGYFKDTLTFGDKINTFYPKKSGEESYLVKFFQELIKKSINSHLNALTNHNQRNTIPQVKCRNIIMQINTLLALIETYEKDPMPAHAGLLNKIKPVWNEIINAMKTKHLKDRIASIENTLQSMANSDNLPVTIDMVALASTINNIKELESCYVSKLIALNCQVETDAYQQRINKANEDLNTIIQNCIGSITDHLIKNPDDTLITINDNIKQAYIAKKTAYIADKILTKAEEIESKIIQDEIKNLTSTHIIDHLLAISKRIKTNTALNYFNDPENEIASNAENIEMLKLQRIELDKLKATITHQKNNISDHADFYTLTLQLGHEKKILSNKYPDNTDDIDRAFTIVENAMNETKSSLLRQCNRLLDDADNAINLTISTRRQLINHSESITAHMSYENQLSLLESHCLKHLKILNKSFVNDIKEEYEQHHNNQTKDKLTHTLLTVNKYIANNTIENRKLLLDDANNYLNKHGKRNQRIGYALVAIGVFALAGALVLSITPVGAILLPSLALIVAASLGATATTSTLFSAFAFFNSREHAINRHLHTLGTPERKAAKPHNPLPLNLGR